MADDFNPFDLGAKTAAVAEAPEGPAAPGGGFDPFRDAGATPSVPSGPRTYLSPVDPEAHWRNLYAGLDGIDKRLDDGQRRAFAALDGIAADPEEQRARAINQTFIAEKLRAPGASLASNWGAVKSAFAKSQLGLDEGEISDKQLYSAISMRLGTHAAPPSLAPGEEPAQIKPWTYNDAFTDDWWKIKRSVGAFWDSVNRSPFDKLPDPPENLPDVTVPGSPMVISPAVAAGVWKGAVKPLLSGVSSPFGAATLGAGSVLNEARGLYPAARAALSAMSGGFAAWMGYGAYQGSQEARKVLADPNASTQDKVAAVASPVSNAVLASLGAVGAVFEALPERAPKIAEGMAGKRPGEVAELMRQEAVTAPPAAADVLNQAATHFEEVAAYDGGPEQWEAAAHPQERITAAAIKLSDGTVSEGPAHEAIRQELTLPEEESVTPVRDNMAAALEAVPEAVKKLTREQVVTAARAKLGPEGFNAGLRDFMKAYASEADLVDTELSAEEHAAQFEEAFSRLAVAKDAPPEKTALPTDAQEGFVTTSGRFVDRVEARQIAEDAGQIVEGSSQRVIGPLPKQADPAEMPKQWFRGVPKSGAPEGQDAFYSTRRDVAENYAGQFGGGDEGIVTQHEKGQFPEKLYDAEGKEALAEELGTKSEPFSFNFDAEVKGILAARGYEGIRYWNGTLGGEEVHVFGGGEKGRGPIAELHSNQVDMHKPSTAFGRTALKNAYGDLERVAYGFDAATPTERHAMAEVWDRSGEVARKDPGAAERLVAQLKANPNLGLSDEQSALILRHKVDLERALNAAADTAADQNAAPAERLAAKAQMRELSGKLLDILNANEARGSEWGREGRWRQAIASEDYSFASQETLLRAAKGAELTDKEVTDLQARIEALKAKNAELEAHVAQRTSESHTQAADRAVRAMERSPRGPRQFRAAETIRVKLKARADESRRFLAGKLFSAGPDTLYHLSVIGADQIYSTGLDFAKWSVAMVDDLGEKVRPLLQEAWEASRKLFHVEQRTGLLDELKGMDENERAKSLSGVAQELARIKIDQGLRGREAVLDAVHKDIEGAIPGISRRQVMDAISGYGQFKPLTHDQITDELRDIKGQLQQVAKLEDLAEGRPVKKTGVEPRAPSEEEKALRAQVAGAERMNKVEPVPPRPTEGVERAPKERFALPAPMDFGKTQEEVAAKLTQNLKKRLEKQITDLEKQIESRTKIVRERRGVVYDDEANRLKARRDDLRAQFDGIFGRKELTDEQRLNIWKAYANRRIGELQERLEAKEFDPPAKRTPPAMDEEGNRLKGELERIKQDFAIARAEAEEAAKPRWQKAAREISGLARASALSGYHTLIKLATFSLGRFAETPITEGLGALLRQLPGIKPIAKLANLEAGAEYEGLAKYYAKAATQGFIDAKQTLLTGKSDLKAELARDRFNVTPVRWYDYFGLSHMVEKSPLLRGEFELRLEKSYQSAIANGVDVTDDLVKAAIRKEAFDYANRAILQESNMFSDWLNSLTARLEAANPKVGKPDVTKVVLSTFIKTFLTKGIVKTPSNYIMQTLERTPLGIAKGTAQAVVAHIQGVDALTPEEANVIVRLLKVGAVGSAMFVWGAIDGTKPPKDRIFGGYYQLGDKRGDDDVGWGKIRIAGHEFPHLATHNPLTESAQMGSTFMRVMRSKLSKKDAQDRGALAGAVTAVVGLASEAPVVNPITQNVQAVEHGEASRIAWDQIAGLVPQLVQNLASDLDAGRSRRAETFGQRMELTVPGLRENVPETKEQKKRDIKERLKKQ